MAEILRRGLDTFAELGYAATTMRELAWRLDVSHNFINDRDGSKGNFWRAVVDFALLHPSWRPGAFHACRRTSRPSPSLAPALALAQDPIADRLNPAAAPTTEQAGRCHRSRRLWYVVRRGPGIPPDRSAVRGGRQAVVGGRGSDACHLSCLATVSSSSSEKSWSATARDMSTAPTRALRVSIASARASAASSSRPAISSRYVRTCFS